jgi:hypothetical protein
VLSRTPLEPRAHLAALIPPPRLHRHRYHGVLAPDSPLRTTATASGRDADLDGAPLAAKALANHAASPRGPSLGPSQTATRSPPLPAGPHAAQGLVLTPSVC